MKDYNIELKKGLSKEDELENKLKEYFKDNLIKSNRYDKYDWKGEKYYYELKSRENTYLKYPTTLIAQNKIFDSNHRFIFNFTDGTYYIEYDKELFENFEVKDFVRNRRLNKIDYPTKYIYIPIKYLKKIL